MWDLCVMCVVGLKCRWIRLTTPTLLLFLSTCEKSRMLRRLATAVCDIMGDWWQSPICWDPCLSVIYLLFRESGSHCRLHMTASYPLRGVYSVHLQILLMGTCRQCGLWSVAGHNHRKVIARLRLWVSEWQWPVRDHVWWGRSKRKLSVTCLLYCLATLCSESGSTHTHTRLTALFLGLPKWAGTRKTKPVWILLKQETVSGSGISWAICKSALCSRQITMPAPQHSVFLQAGCPSWHLTNSVIALK